jgi:hypothetical protein
MNDTHDKTEPAAVPLTPEEEKRRAEQEEVAEFLVFLSTQFRRGQFALQMARAVKALTRAVRTHNKSGSIKITFSVMPVKNAPPGSVQVDAEIVEKLPRGERPRTVMFSTDDGTLTLDHPDQVAAFELPGRAIGGTR